MVVIFLIGTQEGDNLQVMGQWELFLNLAQIKEKDLPKPIFYNHMILVLSQNDETQTRKSKKVVPIEPQFKEIKETKMEERLSLILSQTPQLKMKSCIRKKMFSNNPTMMMFASPHKLNLILTLVRLKKL